MNAAEMEAIIGGYHGDAFGVLGPHPISIEKGNTAWEIRAFLPQARSASVVLNGASEIPEIPMEKQHHEGFFVATLTSVPVAYRFRIESWHHGEQLIEDPYRFGPVISDFDLHLHSEGTLYEAWDTFGSHITSVVGVKGVRFAVWAPSAINVSVAGDFNDWDTRRHPMRLRNSGVWEIFIPCAKKGQSYKYFVRSKFNDYKQLKADPWARQTEVPPKSASVICEDDLYQWRDEEWMKARSTKQWLQDPISTYEVHLESWMRGPAGEPLTYREMAVKLVEYVKRVGYTHVELLPVQEHPYSGSWGYQVTGYFAPTSRFGTPEDFMHLVDSFHAAAIGVIADWVPGHFPKDAHGLAYFDGSALYEHADRRQGEHSEWGTNIFNFGRNEVREFLISNALFWLKRYHIDGLRVDAVASMLYLDYLREPGEWIPNMYGGRENLEAIEFLRRFNELAHSVPGAFTIAEESTSFFGVSKPVYSGGLGFTMKWNMGWMHDMLNYFAVDPVYRKFYHNNITFSILYAFSENFVLPISHDEVVYGKRSLLNRMPGDQWQKFANVRAFIAYMYAHPGKKLLFMGCDIGDYNEWNHNAGVPWQILQFPLHAGLQACVEELNRLYREQPAMHQVEFEYAGFEWVDISDVEKSIISFIRRAEKTSEYILFVCNFTPVPRTHYEIGVPEPGFYEEILNTDAEHFGGSNMGNLGGVMAAESQKHFRPCSISITLPPLSVVAFKRRG
jgi:1,4-alpha-glucan branching enzyme